MPNSKERAREIVDRYKGERNPLVLTAASDRIASGIAVICPAVVLAEEISSVGVRRADELDGAHRHLGRSRA
jgi:hypothetical protein